MLALLERVVHGVSTRKVTEITEALCGTSFSKSTVSALSAGLDPHVRAFHERRLTASSPFVRVDALGLTVREDDRVVSKAALIATGIRDDGGREILGLEIGDSESFAAWEDFFGRRLSRGGLRGCRERDGVSREVPQAAAHDQHAGGLNEEIRRRERVIRSSPVSNRLTVSSGLSWSNSMRRGRTALSQ